jgi:hypothetical protein
MIKLYNILLLITLVISIGALISFIKAPVATVSGKISQSNVSKSVNIYTKDYPKNDTVNKMLNVIIVLIILIIIINLFIHSIPDNFAIYIISIQILFALSIIISAIVGIVFLKLINLKNTDGLNMKHIPEFNIHTKNTNINIINNLSYMAYAFTIITGICGLFVYGVIIPKATYY